MSLAALDEDSPLLSRQGEADFEKEDAEDVVDWTQFAALSKSIKRGSKEAFIPRRGEKDYAPIEQIADRQQKEVEAAREAMFEALEVGGVRGHAMKNHNRATWHPSIARAAMDPKHMSSIHFRTMGRYHSGRKQTELMPEEALYLIERGTLECYTESGVPMSVQHAYTVMLGAERLTQEKFQVYAYLRRLGYAVLRADLEHMLPPPKRIVSSPVYRSLHPLDLLRMALLHPLTALAVRLRALVLLIPRFLGMSEPYLSCAGPRRRRLKPTSSPLVNGTIWRNWEQIFAALKIIPAGHDIPLAPGADLTLPPPDLDEPYRVFFHVYKPNNKFPKTKPPPPDFHLAVVNARQEQLFDLPRITALMQSLPEVPVTKDHAAESNFLDWLLHFLPGMWRNRWRRRVRAQKVQRYRRLKAGRRSVVVALVDSGISTFLRFAEGEFGSLPLI